MFSSTGFSTTIIKLENYSYFILKRLFEKILSSAGLRASASRLEHLSFALLVINLALDTSSYVVFQVQVLHLPCFSRNLIPPYLCTVRNGTRSFLILGHCRDTNPQPSPLTNPTIWRLEHFRFFSNISATPTSRF